MKYFYSILFALSFSVSFGQPAPDFTVTDVDGIDHTLYQDYLDQGFTVVIKLFFVACPPCNAIAPDVQELYVEWGEGQYDVQFMEVTNKANDDDADVMGYRNNHGITFPSISAEGGSLNVVSLLTSGDYGPFFGTPSFYVIAPNGNVTSGVGIGGLNLAIQNTGASGPNNSMPTTQFSFEVTNAASPGTDVGGVEYFIAPGEDLEEKTPIDLDDYENIEEILEAFPSISNPAIVFEKNNQHLVQVSTLDISLITKHILGIQPFDEEYKLVAADVNQNGSISAIDLSTLTKVVLGISPFPGASWLFDPPYVELELNPGNSLDFSIIATKIGNVN